MITLVSLASSSKGNALLVKVGKTRLLVDCGIGSRSFASRCKAVGATPKLDGIIITHAHTDHISGLKSVSSKFHVPEIYIPQGTVLGFDSEAWVGEYTSGDCFNLGEASVETFGVPHDKPTSGLLIHGRGVTVCLITDAGYITRKMRNYASEADAVIVEANYDLSLLWGADYHSSVKERIEGLKGHLGNHHAAALISWLLRVKAPTKQVILCHIGSRSNNGLLAMKQMMAVNRYGGKEMAVGWFPRNNPSAKYTITSRRVRKWLI